MTYDAIVIGVGGMGSATLYHLARSGCRALGLERYGIPHAFGSSHGSTRIIRLAYAEGNHYVPLLRESYKLWRQLEEVSGKSILHVTGGLDIGPADSWTIRGSRASCLHHDLQFQELAGAEINRRFPGYRLPSYARAVFQPDGGYVLSEEAIVAHVAAARQLGAEVLQHTRVVGWAKHGKALRVETSTGSFASKRLIITAGPWVGQCMPELRLHCRAERQVMLWTSPRRPDSFEPARFPVFNMETPLGRFYGFPSHGGEGFKIGKYHHLRQQVNDPDETDRTCGPQDEAVLREAIEEYFPQASGATCRAAACLFTNSPDSDFILDRHPEVDGVFVAAGFSGHGFKFSSVVGRIMADLCLGRHPNLDIARFRLAPERLASRRSFGVR